MDCDYCGSWFDPVETRWLCPHCKHKASCCDGAPLLAALDAPDLVHSIFQGEPGNTIWVDADVSLEDLLAAGYDFELDPETGEPVLCPPDEDERER